MHQNKEINQGAGLVNLRKNIPSKEFEGLRSRDYFFHPDSHPRILAIVVSETEDVTSKAGGTE